MTTLVLSILNGSFSFVHTIRTTIKACRSLNFVKIPSPILELALLDHLKLMDNVVTDLAPSFLIGSSSFFAGNNLSHNIADGFKIQQDPTRDL